MYYHINDIIFLVRFPQFVGSLRRDVWTTAYWRGHPPATSPLSARTLTLSFHLSPLSYVTSFHASSLSLFLSLLASLLSIPFSPINIVKINIPSKLTSRLSINRSYCINRYWRERLSLEASPKCQRTRLDRRSSRVRVVLSRARARDTGRNRN